MGGVIVRWVDRNAGVLLILPALAVLGAFAFYPVAGSVWMSLHRIVLSLPGSGEPFVGLDNYAELARSSVFWHSLLVTLLFVGASTVLEIGLGLGADADSPARWRSSRGRSRPSSRRRCGDSC
jgi:ABC-type sugar transport system permease subunit